MYNIGETKRKRSDTLKAVVKEKTLTLPAQNCGHHGYKGKAIFKTKKKGKDYES